MSESTSSATGKRAGDLELGTPFKRGSADSKGYTIYRIDPAVEDPDEILAPGHILGYNAYADIRVWDIPEDEIVYPVAK